MDKGTWIPEINPGDYYKPFRFKLIVRLKKEEWKSPIIRPDTYNKGDTTKKATVGFIYSVGNMVGIYDERFKVGALVVVDPSINIMSTARAFHWQGKHYVFIDASDIEAIEEAQERQHGKNKKAVAI